MSTPAGVRSDGELDFPNTLRDALSTLPYHAGGVTTLTAATPEDLVAPDDLRRFETMEAIVTGTVVTAGTKQLSAQVSFQKLGVQVGDRVKNTTQSTVGTITGFSSEHIAETSIGFAAGDAFVIDKTAAYAGAEAVEIRQLRLVSDKAIYVRLDGTPSSNHFDVELAANEVYEISGIRAVVRVSVVGVVDTETPKVRWSAWGL